MVRNVASMQSLRHNMEDMNFDAPPRRTLYEDSYASSRSQLSPSQRITTIPQPRQHPIVQLCGTDDYTKQLMNRVATGVATEAEQKAFAQQVQRGLPEMVGSSSSRTSSTRSSPQEDKTARFKQATRENAEKYTKPFCDFLTNNPTVFHCVDAVKNQLKNAGWKELSERDAWKIEPSGKYFVERNGSALMAFSVGGQYKPGNGAAILAGHVDALTAKLKPISQVPNKAGYIQLGVAPYAGAPNNTWWDRDLGIGGRVMVKENNKIVSKLVKLDWPIARIPTLAPHFGAAAQGPFNPETQMVPIIGLEDAEELTVEPFSKSSLIGSAGAAKTFASTQPPRLVRAIANELGLKTSDYGNIINWELELFDVQPATVGGIDKEFIFAGRVDDKLCSWAAIQALVDAQATDTTESSIIKAISSLPRSSAPSHLSTMTPRVPAS
jgi:hypothetical protein